VIVGLLLTAGCPSPSHRLPENGSDPLLGADAPTLPQKGGVVSPSGPEARLTTPLPLTQQTSSTAEMAGGPLKGGREALGIPLTNVNAGEKAWQGVDAGTSVSINKPQPIPSGLAPVPIWQNSAIPSQSSDAEVQALTKQLEDRRAVYQKADPINGGVRFTCIVPRQDGSVLLNYEADAVDTATAMREVLAKIDQKH
jgi:hypothetical protein